MEFDKIIHRRQSVRQFDKTEVEENKLDYLLEVGRVSPVARGLYDDYKFVVLRGEKLLKMQELAAQFSPRGDFTYGAPLSILICHKGDNTEPMQQSIGCIEQSLQLACIELGLESVIVYSAKPICSSIDSLKEFLNYGEYEMQAMVCIGYSKNYQFVNKNHHIEIEK